jgi:hypothetical protein
VSVRVRHREVGRGKTQTVYVTMNIASNRRATLVRELAHVHFPALTVLNLLGNCIQSIEELVRIDMPRLEKISLGLQPITQAATASAR